ncbi:hypothetical protein WMF31_12355 [Sorangium sp. So ce1036]|uniref:hypothetical protein n=1 Tax=Sorangium sp. So ce1036 TaxID=3133328 RepID=UPI003F040B42
MSSRSGNAEIDPRRLNEFLAKQFAEDQLEQMAKWFKEQLQQERPRNSVRSRDTAQRGAGADRAYHAAARRQVVSQPSFVDLLKAISTPR